MTITKKKKELVSFRLIDRWYGLLILLAGFGGFFIGRSYQVQPVFPEPERVEYPVYRPDPETTKKLEDCQASWKIDQAIKKTLRAKLLSLEDK